MTHANLNFQMHSNIAIKMASILYLTDSAYYPAFKSMYRNVVAAMKEAQDITTHLKPLTSHFEVSMIRQMLI